MFARPLLRQIRKISCSASGNVVWNDILRSRALADAFRGERRSRSPFLSGSAWQQRRGLRSSVLGRTAKRRGLHFVLLGRRKAVRSCVVCVGTEISWNGARLLLLLDYFHFSFLFFAI